MMSRIAIIPARSGSKGLMDKNIADLGGRPLIAWTIQAAKDSGCFDEILVSSDSPRYLEIAESWGARPFLRDEDLAGDGVGTYPVIADLLEKLDCSPKDLTLLQPTSPLRTEKHIREALNLFDGRGKDFDYVVSVCLTTTPSILIHPVEEDRSMKHFDEDYSKYRRQDHREYYPNGAIFIADAETYLTQKHFYGSRSLVYEMCREDSVDIDDALDLELARLILSRRREGDRP